MRYMDPTKIEPVDVQRLLTAGVAPRPIALVSTMSESGKSNLAPFSFFNAFGSNPPTIAFSPARRGRDGSLKDTYRNIMQTKECVVHAVTFEMAEQINLASTEYDSEVDEFVKSGFTKKKSNKVKAYRVKESPFHMECKLLQMVHLGENKGSGNLAICEVVAFHVSEDLFQDDLIQPALFDHIGRNGGCYYTRCNKENMFGIDMPRNNIGIGWDKLPAALFELGLSKNQLGFLALRNALPEDARSFISDMTVETKVQLQAAVDARDLDGAWALLVTP